MIQMQPVESSNILEVGYDQDGEVLYITFKSGDTYTYDIVPFDVYQSLMDAESIGSYFHKNIRTNYGFTKV